jgi:hypothetical protein
MTDVTSELRSEALRHGPGIRGDAADRPEGSSLAGRSIARRSVVAGLLGSLAMAAAYAAVVGGVSGSVRHLTDQVRADWYLLAPIVAAFGLQIGLMVELRRRHRLNGAALGATAAGSGASTAGMVACCAHHIADFAPFLGATAAAGFLGTYRAAFMGIGLAVSALAVTIAVRRLRHMPRPPGPQEVACHAP